MQPEYLELVDAAGQVLGTAEKLATHHANTPLHRAFSCYIFDDQDRFLVTQRAAVKKVWPTVWTNSVCGHPFPGESTEDAIKRRVLYEIGMEIKDIACIVPKYIYKTPPYKGIIEHEYCPIYIARAVSQPQPNPLEVDDFRWMNWPDYVAAAEADSSDVYSWWCKDQLRLIKDAPILLLYAS